ncbi:MAG TPA: hypothetical protein H9717_04900 [Candidatus Eisenbergiella merdipullorum]|uniref:Uncharacterized protein n=1 Tax=Candidatus Eisenbergiella merdipullorum TaxID=2838553 RepID=A0A9D2I462_9FIRM|nr:hypothetical protein [Candidatus Eisenbergiella merdipullorum]
MKKKMAIVLSAILACSMGMTAMAAPSPSIQQETVQNVTVNTSVTVTGTPQVSSISSEASAVLAGTTFRNAAGQAVDASSVRVVVAPSDLASMQESAGEIAAAMTTDASTIYNFTGLSSLALTDNTDTLNVLDQVYVGLQDDNGDTVSHNGSVSTTFLLRDILGGETMEEGETIQALYQRADGSWVVLPVVIRNGVVAIALPAFSAPVKVVFLLAKGTPMEDVQVTVRSPQT